MNSTHKNSIIAFLFFVLPIFLIASSNNLLPTDDVASDAWMNPFLYLPQNPTDSIISSCPESERYCSGTCKWPDEKTYEGEFQYGIPHGKGVMKWPNNENYTGQFEGGLRHGFGMHTYEDGSTYEGDWVTGKKEGQGFYRFANGDEYLGEFKDDQIDGEGTILWQNGESYSGFWKKGKRHGKGTLTREDGSKFIGMNVDGERHGEGIITWVTGDTLHGQWQNGSMDQEGVFQFADGSAMISYWENGKIKDKATYIQTNGFKISAPTGQLANLVSKTSLGNAKSVESNLGLAFYAIGFEFKSSNDYDNAERYLQFAMQFADPLEENSDIYEKVETQIASLAAERESSGLIKVNVATDKKE